ncbi:MAG: carbon storage regulator [Pirellulales bacterium]
MLVLTRKAQESIRIGNDITITVVRLEGKTVRLGVEAPRSVRVLRAELPVHETASSELPGVNVGPEMTISCELELSIG